MLSDSSGVVVQAGQSENKVPSAAPEGAGLHQVPAAMSVPVAGNVASTAGGLGRAQHPPAPRAAGQVGRCPVEGHRAARWFRHPLGGPTRDDEVPNSRRKLTTRAPRKELRPPFSLPVLRRRIRHE